jgi:hypothetical protein
MNHASLKKFYDSMDQTCLVMIDRSMWFAKSFEALQATNFSLLVEQYSDLRGREDEFHEPVTYAFSYAQRVFLCSAMELCLLHHHQNSVAFLIQQMPQRIDRLTNLLKFLKRKHYAQTIDEWIALDWDVRFQHLRELSFSNLAAAARLFEDIYGNKCLLQAWGATTYADLDSKYQQYQLLRNGILHRGGELNSGAKITATEKDIEAAFNDSKLFRDAILALSRWCYRWWQTHELFDGSLNKSTRHPSDLLKS